MYDRQTPRPYKYIPHLKNKDGTLKHIRTEGARYHVLWYDDQGIHCSEPNCEVNRREIK